MKRSWKVVLATMTIVLFAIVVVIVNFSRDSSSEFEWVDLDPTNPVMIDSLTGGFILEGNLRIYGGSVVPDSEFVIVDELDYEPMYVGDDLHISQPRTLAKWLNDDLEALKEELDYVKGKLNEFRGKAFNIEGYALWRLSILEEMKLVYPEFWEK